MKDAVLDPKQQAILISAFQAFATYGFRKTSMDDIARGANMSRPALYLRYRNKEDILRTLIQSFYDSAAHGVQQALAGPGTISQVLAKAFSAQSGGTMQAMLFSPHGQELFDTGKATALDIVQAGESRFCDIYSAWLTDQVRAGRIELTAAADDVAMTITWSLKGLKTTLKDAATFATCVANLASLIGAGLERVTHQDGRTKG